FLPAERAIAQSWVLRSGERLDHGLGEVALSVQHAGSEIHPGDSRQIRRRGEQPGVGGDAAEPERVLVVDLTANLPLAPRVELRRRDRREQSRIRPVARAV